MASRVSGLIVSATLIKPANFFSTATNITVCPIARNSSAFPASGVISMPTSFISSALPSKTALPSMLPRTPLPVMALKPVTGKSGRLCAFRCARMACASGCSLIFSSAAASTSTSARAKPSLATICCTFGTPSVSVPVLSTISVSIFSISSSASASLISTPSRAPRPIPTMTDIGVASPSAQGQAMISTDTAATSPFASPGAGPTIAHTKKASTAAAMTVGTNHPDTRSASFCMGARERPA